jgi:protein-S-isoprenylcysteine O-methyltransferase Ste14
MEHGHPSYQVEVRGGEGTTMLKIVIQNLSIVVVVIGPLLFIAAGAMDWPQAWVFLAVFFGCGLGSGFWLLKTNPELLAERMKSPLRDNQRPRDRAVTGVLYAALCVWLVLIALDARRFGWSSVPTWAEAIGGVLVVGAFYGWSRVLRENSFAVTSVRLQPKRGQFVISTGSYAIVRHPMYAVAIAAFIGTPLMLASFWGLLRVLVFMPLLALGALGEEAILAHGVPGYREYAARVRFRLVPGLW